MTSASVTHLRDRRSERDALITTLNREQCLRERECVGYMKEIEK